MTLENFFRALERRTADVDALWRVNEDQEIRTDDGHCPPSFQADTTPGVVHEAMRSLGMSAKDASKVVVAADSSHTSVYRDRLLRACRLHEVVGAP